MQTPRRRRNCGSVLLWLALGAGGRAQAPSGHQEQLHQADTAFHAGYAAAESGDLAAAQEDFQKVVQLAPEIAEGHSALGSVLVQLGQAALAIPELERALAIKADDRSAQTNLAVAFEETGAYEKSLALFRALDQDSSEAWPATAVISYVRALGATGNADEALLRMQKAVSDAVPGSADAATLHDALGSLEAQRQNWPTAQTQFEQALAIDANLAAAHEHLGVTLLAEQRTPEALRELSTAVQLAPDRASTQLEFGRALIAAGQDEQALPVLKRAAELAPDSLDGKYQLALALQGTGQEQQSIPLFEQFVAAQPRNSSALTKPCPGAGADRQIERRDSALPASHCRESEGSADLSGPGRCLPATERS